MCGQFRSSVRKKEVSVFFVRYGVLIGKPTSHKSERKAKSDFELNTHIHVRRTRKHRKCLSHQRICTIHPHMHRTRKIIDR